MQCYIVEGQVKSHVGSVSHPGFQVGLLWQRHEVGI